MMKFLKSIWQHFRQNSLRFVWRIHIWFLFLVIASPVFGQSAREIIQKMDDNMNAGTSTGTMKLVIERPDWTREITIKSWTKGRDFSLMLIQAPARDKGSAFLKRHREIWNWQPTIDRVIKMPPSMMSQSWMGSDFTNDDLVRQSSILNDYTHELSGSELISGSDCWEITLTPVPNAPVVWGKVIVWVEKNNAVQLKAEFFDDEGDLVNTMLGSEIKTFGKRSIATKMEMIPSDKPGHKTIIIQTGIEFDKPLPDSFFSLQNLKNAK